ncbi:hypothetical protein [Rhodovulum marinum]|uniref:Uncharacterized protein n=1 Tax=Rhodovulum marinum TaxID=320662 RepID=A0A4R2PQI9_9RHOB|nr:hypothetical protein [Rhodovulum marinum]TCP38072.1 hypothetical protein EV662_12216 [Rhodovulum marinum]
MIDDFLPRHEDDDVEIKNYYPVPGRHRGVRVTMPKYYWRLLDWLSDRRSVTAGYIIHHFANSRYEDWSRISEYFILLIDDWVRWEAESITKRRKVHHGCNVYLNSSLAEDRTAAANDGRVKWIESRSSTPPEVPE